MRWFLCNVSIEGFFSYILNYINCTHPGYNYWIIERTRCFSYFYILTFFCVAESGTNMFSGVISKLNPNIKKTLISYILALRLECRCSIQSISCLLKRFECKNTSEGYISQILKKIGSILPSTLKNLDSRTKLLLSYLYYIKY